MLHPIAWKMWLLMTQQQGGDNVSLMTSTESALDLLVLEELEFETPCEGTMHAIGKEGHDPSQPATHSARCPECSHVVLLCAAKAMYLYNFNEVTCDQCKHHGPPSTFNIHRIPGK